MIYGVATAPGQPFTLERFDVILWNLQGLFGRQRLYADLVLELQSTGTGDVTEFDLIVPFLVSVAKQLDIGASEATPLTTPGFKWQTEGQVLEEESSRRQVSVTHIASFEPVVDQALRPDDRGFLVRRAEQASRVKVHLANGIAPGTSTIVRMRFDIQGRTSSVYWKRSGLGINGGLFDLRIFSEPATNLLANLPVFENAIGPRASSITCVVRATWQVQNHFPVVEPFLLERRSMNNYLGRLPDLRNQGALVAYRVENDSNRNEPAVDRLFLNVAREFGLLPIGNFLRMAVLAVALILLSEDIRTGLDEAAGWIWAGIGAISLAWLLSFAARNIKLAKSGFSKARDLYNRFENWVFRNRK